MSGKVISCQGCGAFGMFSELLDMGLQPLPEGARAGARYPLCLVRCQDCGLAQLDYVVPQEELFQRDHPYSTGNSASLRAHYRELTDAISEELKTGDLVVDIGANDGTLLDSYPTGLRLVAVEPTDQIKRCDPRIDRWQGFFSSEKGRDIRASAGPAKVITACNVLAHVPDVHDFLDGVTALLDDDGVFVTENHDLASILNGLQVDTIYHEHLRYYSAGTLARLLEDHGLHVTRVAQVPTHGGSLLTYARKNKGNFSGRALAAATALRGMLWEMTYRGSVYGIGASTRAVPLIHYAGIESFISLVCEVPGSDKIGHLMPGTQIPVVDEERLIGDQPAYALLFSWHMADVIVPKLRAAGYRGKFIVPLPEPRVLDD